MEQKMVERWIPVTERLPEVNTDELPVTHWMPLPKPPKEIDHG